VIVSPTSTGKSTFLSSQTVHLLSEKKNVLFISTEMSQKTIAQRIAANVFETPMEEIKKWTKTDWVNAWHKSPALGRLRIRAYASKH
jgi:KaiC/GvpD/RAD55 family RecA-like ATPase